MDTILPGLPEENCQIFDINKGHDENICTPTFLQECRMRILMYEYGLGRRGDEDHIIIVVTVAGWVGASGGHLPLRRLDRDGGSERGRDGVEVRGHHQAGRRADRGQQHGPAQVGYMLFRI